jgi:hypothetical protein
MSAPAGIDPEVLTGELVTAMSEDDARQITERIASNLGILWQDVKQAYEGRVWLALGYGSWDEYCTTEFGNTRIQLPREDRQEVVQSLREAGLSIRAIASATGSSRGTVGRDLEAGVPNGTPDDGPREPDVAPWPPADEPPKITGADGKSYPSTTKTTESKSTTTTSGPSVKSLREDLYANDDAAMKRMLHKKITTALVGFGEARKWEPARVAAALPDRDNQRVFDLLDGVQVWLDEYRSALAGADVIPLRSVK